MHSLEYILDIQTFLLLHMYSACSLIVYLLGGVTVATCVYKVVAPGNNELGCVAFKLGMPLGSSYSKYSIVPARL